MQTPSDDEIAKFFDDLTPDAFTATPKKKAVRKTTRKRNPAHDFQHADEDFPHHGSDMFEQFVLRHLSQTDRGDDPYFAVLHSGTAWRHFTMNDETLPEFMRRVALHSVKFGTQWLFMAVPGEASMSGMFDPDDPASMQRARDAGVMLNVTNWYAESVEPTNEEIRYGIVMQNEDGERQLIESTSPTGMNPAFKKVLHIGR